MSGLESPTGRPPGFTLGHRPALDGVRAIAIGLVVLRHVDLQRFGLGFLGVDVFFALSGFLITILLVQEWRRTGRISLRAFYGRRALRLLPALALMLAGTGVLVAIFDPAKLGTFRVGAVAAALYVANWALAIGLDLRPVSHTWSLAIEEQFYLLWPLCLIALLASRARPPLIATMVALGAVVALVWRAHLALGGATPGRIYHGFDMRADALLVGCFAGTLVAWELLPRGAAARALVHLATLACFGALYAARGALYTPRFYELGGFTLVALASALFVLDVTLFEPRLLRAVLELPPLVFLGKISYGIYLWHVPIFELFPNERFRAPAALVLSLKLAASVAIPALSFYLVERPLLRFKPKRPGAGQDEPSSARSV